MNNNGKISLNTEVVRNNRLDAADIDGEKVMMDLEKGKYYGLNDLGSRIWEIVEESRKVSSIVATLTQEYDIGTGECEDQVIRFLEKMYKEGIVSILS